MPRNLKTRMEIWVAKGLIAIDALWFALKKRVYRAHYGPERDWPRELVQYVYLPDGAPPSAVAQLKLFMAVKELAVFGNFDYVNAHVGHYISAYLEVRSNAPVAVTRIASLIQAGAPRRAVLALLIELGDWNPHLVAVIRTPDEMQRLEQWLDSTDHNFELNPHHVESESVSP